MGRVQKLLNPFPVEPIPSDSGRHSSVTRPVMETQMHKTYQVRPPCAGVSGVEITMGNQVFASLYGLGLDYRKLTLHPHPAPAIVAHV